MSFEAIKKQEQEYILHSYGRVDVALSHGKNVEAWDVDCLLYTSPSPRDEQ